MAKFLATPLLLVCILAVGIFPGHGQDSPQALFDLANIKLESGENSEALSLYKKLESQQTVSGALFLNLGITYQRVDSLGKAKYYFLKASRFDETSDRATQALEQIEQQFSRQSAILPQLPWNRATNWLQHQIGATTLLATGIILLNLGIVLYVAGWFAKRFSKSLNIGGIVVAGISILLIVASFYTRYVADRYSTAVMVTEKISVREQPGEEASLVSQAFEGYAFTVDHYRSSSASDWSYIRMSNGLYGWIPDSEIMVL